MALGLTMVRVDLKKKSKNKESTQESLNSRGNHSHGLGFLPHTTVVALRPSHT